MWKVCEAERSVLVFPSHPHLLTVEKIEGAGTVFIQDTYNAGIQFV